ncbi:MAG TPA: hypothetical protein VM287_05755 [Egibacteraceae bacterium]|nr:hypothetical protein [Egibacteraceae bacterium]
MADDRVGVSIVIDPVDSQVDVDGEVGEFLLGLVEVDTGEIRHYRA